MPKSKVDKIEAEELHKRIVRKFERRPVEVGGIDDVWCADLVEMGQFAKQNKGYKYILTVIDVLSKYAWAIPLKNKRSNTVLDAFEGVVKRSKRRPNRLWVDQGSEFINREFKAYFPNVYHTYGEFHAAPIERFNRTLKDIMWYKFTKHDSHEWVSRLPKLLAKYNKRRHSTIRMTPEEGSQKRNEEYLLEYQENRVKKAKKASPKLKVGDIVRVSRWKGKLEKGYTTNWSNELYEVTHVIKTRPTTYRVKTAAVEPGSTAAASDEEVQGTFYEQELQKSKLEWSPEGIYLPSEWKARPSKSA